MTHIPPSNLFKALLVPAIAIVSLLALGGRDEATAGLPASSDKTAEEHASIEFSDSVGSDEGVMPAADPAGPANSDVAPSEADVVAVTQSNGAAEAVSEDAAADSPMPSAEDSEIDIAEVKPVDEVPVAVAMAEAAPDSAMSLQQAEANLVAALSAFVGQPIALDGIKASPAQGIVEAKVTGGPMIYATADGEFFFLQGDLHGLGSDGVVNLTEEGRISERREVISGIDVEDMIVFTPEEGAQDYITVFTDISCGYCQKLHREIDELNGYGIEVRYLAYPRGGINSEGARQLETAWCADNRQETLTKLKSGIKVPMISCNSELIAAHYELGGQLGVRGTPAILTSDGRMIPGYQPARNLANMLGLN